jgi:hypothetical protein
LCTGSTSVETHFEKTRVEAPTTGKQTVLTKLEQAFSAIIKESKPGISCLLISLYASSIQGVTIRGLTLGGRKKTHRHRQEADAQVEIILPAEMYALAKQRGVRVKEGWQAELVVAVPPFLSVTLSQPRFCLHHSPSIACVFIGLTSEPSTAYKPLIALNTDAVLPKPDGEPSSLAVTTQRTRKYTRNSASLPSLHPEPPLCLSHLHASPQHLFRLPPT